MTLLVGIIQKALYERLNRKHVQLSKFFGRTKVAVVKVRSVEMATEYKRNWKKNMNIKFVVCQIGIVDILENRDDSVNSLGKNYKELLIRLMELYPNAKVGTSCPVINPEEQNRDTKLQNDVVQINKSMRKFCTDQNNKSLKYWTQEHAPQKRAIHR